MGSNGTARDSSAPRLAVAGVAPAPSISRLFDGHEPTTVLHGIYDVSGAPAVHGWEALMRGPQGLPFEGPMLAFAFAHSFDLLAELDLKCIRCALAAAPRERLLFLNVHPTTLLGRGAEAIAKLVAGSRREPGDVVLEIVRSEGIDLVQCCRYRPEGVEDLARRRASDVIGKNFFTEVAPCTDVREFAGRYREGVAAGALHETFDYVFAFTPPKPVRVTLYFSGGTGTGWVFVRG